MGIHVILKTCSSFDTCKLINSNPLKHISVKMIPKIAHILRIVKGTMHYTFKPIKTNFFICLLANSSLLAYSAHFSVSLIQCLNWHSPRPNIMSPTHVNHMLKPITLSYCRHESIYHVPYNNIVSFIWWYLCANHTKDYPILYIMPFNLYYSRHSSITAPNRFRRAIYIPSIPSSGIFSTTLISFNFVHYHL